VRRATWLACEIFDQLLCSRVMPTLPTATAHLQLHGVDHFFEVLRQDIALCGQRAHPLVLISQVSVDAEEVVG
jgi:hypothetical protein